MKPNQTELMINEPDTAATASSNDGVDLGGKRLILVDGHGLAFRAFYALPETLATAAGEITNATFGFTSMLLEVMRAHEPDFLLVTFDVGRTFRHDMSEDYKAHRRPMPDELRPQIDRIREVLRALNVPVYEAEGFEADDVIGTLARQSAERGLEALVVTRDSDLLQLVDDAVLVVMPGPQRFGEYRIFDRDAVMKRYGFGPERVIDYKALVGDKSDNIPGVAGIGDKSAKQLIEQFNSIEEMYEHIDEISATRTRNALKNDRENAFHSRELATVVRDVPVALDLDACVVHDFDRASAIEVFQTLEFRSLLSKLPVSSNGTDEPAADMGPARQIAQPRVVSDRRQLEALVEEIAHASYVAVDVETDGLNARRDRLVGVAIATTAEQASYVPLAHASGPNAPPDVTRELLTQVLANHDHIVTHNGKFDITVLEHHGFSGITIAFDTMLAAYLLGERALGLKDLAFNQFGWEMTPITDLIGRGKNQVTMDKISVNDAAPYACADVEATIRLEPIFQEQLDAREQTGLLQDIELKLVPVLIEMEDAGIALDVDLLNEMSTQLEGQISEISDDIYNAVGHEFNLNSPAQLSEILFDEIGLPPSRKTKTGYSVSQDILENLIGAHEVVDLVLEYRSLAKLKSTYVDALPRQVDPIDKRIHTTFNQTIAATGRLSSTDPNLQNIPVRSPLGRQVRRAFIADNRPESRLFDEETVLFGADYSQMELRLMAHYSQDPALIEAFSQGQDIHAATAAEVFEVPIGEVNSDQRATAKVVNFGIMYGMSAFGLTRDTGMDRAEAQQFIDRYYERFSGVEHFIANTIAETERTGYATTLYGRRRYLPDITARGPRRQGAERAAINMPIQGTAADIMKLAMIEIDSRMNRNGVRARLLLQVHDELIFESPKSEADELCKMVTSVMTGITELSVPLEVESKIGENWEEMRPFS